MLDRRALVDGAWWPYSHDARAGLPGLIAAVDRLLDRVMLRIGVHRDAWQRIPRRIPARGRQVRVGWFRHADPRVIILFFAAAEPVVLLIIPPGYRRRPCRGHAQAHRPGHHRLDCRRHLHHRAPAARSRPPRDGRQELGQQGERGRIGDRAGGAVHHQTAVSAGVTTCRLPAG
ncbi:DUF5994 family protein [Nonomuraea sp. SYSU D8015]|uniref:DUF5994 family protein n=1 Tax=Nonomuraea sp. SYSU D8015 TaxID=2593644 RepID=UPI001CB71A3E